MIRTKFWGVRGSVPSPGPATAEIGGNTSCVEMTCDHTRLIFDGGTGLRGLGRSLEKEMPLEVHLFFSHVHWDHIQGFPFFAPAFEPGNTIHMYGATNVTGTLESAMSGQMESPNFPVKLDQLPSQLVFHDLSPGEALQIGNGVVIRAEAGNHPGGVLAYRVQSPEGESVVYMTDTEYGSDADDKLVRLADESDVLIYDCQYTPEEYEGKAGTRAKIGWGHSTFEGGVDIAKRAGVEKLVLFHHDPDQDDEAVRAKERRARETFENSIAAYEGLVVEV